MVALQVITSAWSPQREHLLEQPQGALPLPALMVALYVITFAWLPCECIYPKKPQGAMPLPAFSAGADRGIVRDHICLEAML